MPIPEPASVVDYVEVSAGQGGTPSALPANQPP